MADLGFLLVLGEARGGRTSVENADIEVDGARRRWEKRVVKRGSGIRVFRTEPPTMGGWWRHEGGGFEAVAAWVWWLEETGRLAGCGLEQRS